jgi:hypothetical protein
MCHRERRGWLVHIPRSTEVRGKLLNSCRRERSVSHEPVIRTAKSVSAAGQNQIISKVTAILCQEPAAHFFTPIVNWITFTRGLLGQGAVHRMARADFNVRAGKVAWRYTALAALFFCARLISGGVARTAHVEKMPVGYPNRSLLRRGLDTRSTSQSIQTKAMPRPTTTPKNSNVKPGAVSMVTIHNALQAAYQ